MHNKTLVLTLLSIFTLLSSIPMAFAHNAPFGGAYDWTHLVVDAIGGPETTDPAWAYDTASVEFVQNVYEPLIWYDRDYTKGPYRAGEDLSAFVPVLATTVPTVGNGLIANHVPPLVSPNGDLIYSTWTFPIRQGVQFHTGRILTAADAEYSIERVLVQDRTGGPQWMLYEPLLATFAATDPVTDPNFGLRIDYAVQSSGNNVIFNLAKEYPELTFKQIVAGTWARIMDKAWAIAEGDLDVNSVGGWGNWAAIYVAWYNPSVSFIEDAIGKPTGKDGGTGPYEYDYWTVDVARSVVKNDGGAADPNPGGPGRPPDPHADITPASTYWDGWPARVRPGGATRIGGNVERVTWRDIPSWPSRLADWLAGLCDITSVPKTGIPQALVPAVNGEMVHCFYPLDSLSLSAFFFTHNVSTTSIYLGPGFEQSVPHAFLPDRAPIDLFSDVNVRKGFAHAFDYDWYINTVYLTEGNQPSDPVIKGLPYDNLAQAKYVFDPFDVILVGTPPNSVVALNVPGASDRYWDKNSNGVWDLDEHAIRDVNSNGIYEPDVDVELAGLVGFGPSVESVYRDADNSQSVSIGDELLAGSSQPLGRALVAFAANENHTENVAVNGLYDFGEAIYRDVDGSGDVTASDVLLRGAAQPLGATLVGFVANERHTENVAANGLYDPIYLIIPGADDKYYDINVNAIWDKGEPAIRDTVAPSGSYNMGKAGYYLRLAWGGIDSNGDGDFVDSGEDVGALWKGGMSFTVTYNTGNIARQLGAEEIANKVNSLNPDKFNLVAQGLTLGTVYLPAMVAHELPIFFMSYIGDYADPHNFVFAFQHSQGIFASAQEYSNSVVDALVEAGIATPEDVTPYDNSLDNPDGLGNLDNKPAGDWRTWPTSAAYYVANPLDLNYPRRAIYYALQEIYYEDVPSVPLVQPKVDHWEQPWVRGWYYNSLYQGIYAYHLWKAKTHYGDTNWDGAVNILDVSTLSSSWTGPPRGQAYFLPQADLTGGTGRTGTGIPGPVKGIPNGKVEIDDLALISAYWDGPPQGPSHP